MIGFWTKLFDTSDFPARWRCGKWDGGHGWLHILSDLGVWSAYLAIPIALLLFARNRKDIPFRNLFWLFSAFILLCGTTHLMEAVIFWWPAYRLAGVLKLATAVVSWVTVLSLIPVIPRAFALRSPQELEREVAERRLVEAELRSQKQLLESILDSMGEAVLVTDAAGAVRLQNRAFRNLHDVTPPSARSEWPRAFGLYLPDGTTLCPSDEVPLFRAERGEACDDVPLVIVNPAHPDGLPISVTGRPIVGPSGIEGAVIAVRDVSATRRAAVELRASEQRYRLLVNGVRDYAIFLLDPKGRVASWNVGAERIKGYTADEIVGQHFSCFYPPEDVAAGKLEHELRVATETGQYEEEGWRVRKGGSRFWAHVVISAINGEDGRLQGFAKSTRDLTARLDAEKALQKSEQRFRAIFDQTLQFIGLMSADGTLLEANRTALAAAGLTEEQVLGKPFWETGWWTHDAAQQERLRDAVGRASAGETVRFEARVRVADGGLLWIDFSLKRYVADDAVVYLIPEGRDIASQKQAELALRESEQRLRLAAEAAGVGVWEWNVLTNRIHWNDQMFRMYQVAPTPDGFVPYEAWSGAVLEEDLAREEGLLRDTVQRLGSGTRAFRIRWPDGQCRFIEAAEQVRTNADGRAERVVGTNLDVTAHRRAEETIRESEERFRSAFESAPIGMALVAPDGKWLRVNRAQCELVGYTQEELLAIDFQTITHPDDLGADLGYVVQVLEGTISEYQMEKRYFHKRGHVVHVVLSVSLVRDGAGAPQYFIAQIMDISARKRTELALAANEALLEQFVKHAPAAIAMLDTELRYVRASDQWVTDYHLTGQQILGRCHYDVFPDVPDRWKQIHQRVLAGAVENCPEDPFPREDGGTEWLQWDARPWRAPGGEIGGVIFFTQVITARVRAAQRASLVHDATRILAEAETATDAVVGVIRAACATRGWEVGEFWQLTDDETALEFAGGWAAPEVADFARSSIGLSFEIGTGLPGRVCASNWPLVIPDLATDPSFLRKDEAAQCGLRLGMAFPVVVSGVVVGVFDFLARRTELPSPEDMALLEGLAGQLGQWVERKRAETALVESESRFRAVFNASLSGLLLVDRAGRIVLTNDVSVRMFGWEQDELLGAAIERVVPERHRQRHVADRDAYLAAPTARAMGVRAGLTGQRKDGSEFPVETELLPVPTARGTFVLVSVIDVTERKRIEEALSVSEERLRLALGNANHGLWDWDVRSGTVFYDETWAGLHGYDLDEVAVDYAWWEASIHPEDRSRLLAALTLALASDAAPYDVEYRGRQKDGTWAWLNTRGRVQNRDATGAALRMMGTLQDVTERKRAEEELVRSVREKEVMLREIHHRVKNNLAVISSLFHLQAGTVEDTKSAQVLREAQDRVRSMALVHEHLYNSADLGSVAFGEYANTLAMQIIQTYQTPATSVQLVTQMEPVALSIEQSIPCGLILNELLSNCLKHAFRGRARGTVTVSISAADDTCSIRVSDDGVGAPAELDVRAAKSLGVRLVRILTRQLVGSVEYHSPGTGTEVRLVFPIQSQRKN